jgi:hypothetical protein
MDFPGHTDKAPGLRWKLITLLGIGILVALVLWVAAPWKAGRRWAPQQAEPAGTNLPDPRLAFETPYRNVRPDVQYIGDEACASCHPTETTSFRQHPMGRSAALLTTGQGTQVASPGALGERYDKSTNNPFEALGYEFLIEPREAAIVHRELRRDNHREIVTTLEAEVLLAIGSGTQGRSYVISRNGYFFQSPISWFTRTHSWRLSPGFVEAALHFQRTIAVQCLFCHVNHFTPVANTAYRYAEPLPRQLTIGCERCHGPGQLHVERRNAGESFQEFDETIVNPARLEPKLREAVCQQCHLEGEQRIVSHGRTVFDYRPGLPLDLIFSTFVRPPEAIDSRRIVNHVEQMYMSRCFQASKGPAQLGCISCHDPHQLPAPQERVAFYRGRCLNCHQISEDGGVVSNNRTNTRDHDSPLTDPHSATHHTPLAIRHSPTDDCMECHMPRRPSANVAHAAVTDHRVVRRPERPAETSPENRSGLQPETFSLVDFYRDTNQQSDAERQRDFGLALIYKAASEGRREVRQALCQQALPFLDRAVQSDADDLDALEAQSFALWALDTPHQALAIVEGVLARVPERERSQELAARLSTQVGKVETAIAHWRRLLAANPWNPVHHNLLAGLLRGRQDWPGAMEEASASLRIDPNQSEARMILVAGYLKKGDKLRARQEFKIVERLRPPELEYYRAWVKEQEH